MALEEASGLRFLPGVQARRRDAGVRMRDGMQVCGRDLDVRHEREQVPEHDLRHRARGAEDRDPHQESWSF